MATIDGNKKKLTVSGEAIESAVNSKHEHSNSAVLNKLSDNNGTLQYNGADITGGSASETTASKVKMADNTTVEDNISQLKEDLVNKASKETVTNIANNIETINTDISNLNETKANRNEIANGLTAKGSCLYAELPSENNDNGDYYYCSDGNGTDGAGNYVWNGEIWFFGGNGSTINNLCGIDISSLLLTNGLDNTTIIQNALDTYKNVYINKVGEYAVKTLKMGDNMSLHMANGVILKQLANTSDFVITNANKTEGNINIGIYGGTIDNNYENGNNQSGINLSEGGYPGFGIHFEKVTNLEFKNTTHLNSQKYAVSICNSSNIKVYNMNFNTHSDGLHFQAGCKHIYVDGLYGTTGDDIFSCTIGDYSLYEASVNTGDIENVVLKNVIADSNVGHVRFTGAGSLGTSVFRNISVENVKGCAVFITSDTATENTNNNHLYKTYAYNVNLNNIVSVALKLTEGKGIKINNCNLPNVGFLCTATSPGKDSSHISDITFENINGIDSTVTNLMYVNATTTQVDKILIRNIDAKRESTEENSYLVESLSSSPTDFIFENVKYIGEGATDLQSPLLYINGGDVTNKSTVTFNNVKMYGILYGILLGNPIELNILNSDIDTTNIIRFNSRMISSVETKTKVNIANSKGKYDFRELGASMPPVALNMQSGYTTQALTVLTPDVYDIVNRANHKNAWNGTEWVTLF